MKQALPAAARGKPLEIWFQDEARIGQKGTLTRIWARLGSRPLGPRDSRYEWAYIFAAVCPERATGAALVMPYANTEADEPASPGDQPRRRPRRPCRAHLRRPRLAHHR